MLDKLKGKLDKKALGMAVMLMIMSWAALPIVYYLIVRKKKPVEEVKTNVLEKSGCKNQKGTVEVADNKMDTSHVEYD